MLSIPKVLINLHNILEASEECKKHIANKQFTKIKKDHLTMENSAIISINELIKVEEQISEEHKRSRILKIRAQINGILRNQYIASVKRKHDILIIDPHREFTKQGLIEDIEKINKLCVLFIGELARISQIRGAAA